MFGDQLRDVLAWCASAVGPCEPADTDVRFHGRASVLKLKTASGFCYLKVHRERATRGSGGPRLRELGPGVRRQGSPHVGGSRTGAVGPSDRRAAG